MKVVSIYYLPLFYNNRTTIICITTEICSSLLEFIYSLWYFVVLFGNLKIVISEAATIGVVKIGEICNQNPWKKPMKEIILAKLYPTTLLKNEVFHCYFSRVLNAGFRTLILQNNYFWFAAAFISCTFTTIFGFIIILFFHFQKYISGNRKLMASSSSDKICIRCGKIFKENNHLNH